MIYPTMEEVEAAGIMQLCRWGRFLDSPGMSALNGDDHDHDVFEATRVREAAILDRILARRDELGGMTPAISKAIGW